MTQTVPQQLYSTLVLLQTEINQLRAKTDATEELIKKHPELFGEFQTYENLRRDKLRNPNLSTSLDASLEELRKSLLP